MYQTTTIAKQRCHELGNPWANHVSILEFNRTSDIQMSIQMSKVDVGDSVLGVI